MSTPTTGPREATKSPPTLELDRPAREALRGELVDRLSGAGDVHLLLERGDQEGAQRLATALREETRLLDDLGWAREDPRETFELTMAATELASVLGRLHRDASGLLATLLARPREDEALAERSATAARVSGDLLAQVAGRTGEEPCAPAPGPRSAP